MIVKKYFNLVILFVVFCNSVCAQNYTKYKGAKSKVNIVKEFSFANAYDYNFDASEKDSLLVNVLNDNSLEALISKKFSNELAVNKKDSIAFSVKLVSRLIVEVDNKKHYLVSYETSDNRNRVVSNFYNNGNDFIENTSSNNEIKLLKSILKNANAYLLFKFYNKRNDKKHALVGKLKVEAKNEQGILDIKKLTKVLEANKAQLASYFDN